MSKTIFDYVKENNIDKINELLESGVNVNVKDKYGNTPLYYASTYGQLQIAKLIIEYGADVNIKCYGSTPLHQASYNRRTEVTKLLLECNADVNVKDSIGWTPLLWASYNGHVDIVKLLVDHGEKFDV